MQCATESEIDKWLGDRSIPKNPYSGSEAPEHYLQFYPPARHRHQEAFMRHFLGRIIPESESLIHITGWALYQPSEMIAMSGIRESHGEVRLLIEAPGHILTACDTELCVSIFSLSASFAWSSYFYSASNKSTLYNWEGEIFDFWTDSSETHSEMIKILREFDLKETN